MAILSSLPLQSHSPSPPAQLEREEIKINFENPIRLPLSILGIPFDNLNMEESVKVVDEMIQKRVPQYVVTANMDFLVQSLYDIELRRILWDAHLVLCDGMPLIWISKLFGNRLCERVAGSDLVPQLLELSDRKGYRVFFLGGTEEVAAKAVENVKAKYPGIKHVEAHAPPFLPLLEMDHAQICEKIKKADPDILFVSFSCPKSEKWFFMNYQRTGVPVGIGVGATIDFLAGRFKRAPNWISRWGFEWLFRLLQEPRRLYRRYFKDFVCFARAMSRQSYLLRALYHKRSVQNSMVVRHDLRHVEIVTPRCLDIQTIRSESVLWKRSLEQCDACVLNASNTEMIDSTGVGFLIAIHRKMKQKGGRFVLLNPSPEMMKILQLLHLTTLFQISQNVIESREFLHKKDVSDGVLMELNGTRALIYMRGEITAGNAFHIAEFCMRQLEIVQQKELDVDLSAVKFVDSSGIGAMVRIKKEAHQCGISIRYIEPNENVRNVLEITKLSNYLLCL